MRVGYVMSRFPRLTETFILSEILAVRERGVDVQLYPLLRESAELMQPDVQALVDGAHFEPFVSRAILRSNLLFLRRHPRRYLRTLAAVVRTTWRSPNFLVGGLAIFPKVVHNAVAMRRAGVDHVHCHFANHPALAGFVIRRLVGIPYSFTAHGSDLHKDRTGLVDKVREARFVVAISEYNRRMIVEECDGRWAEKVEVIHCGVRTDLFAMSNQTGTAGGAGGLRILCIGTLHEVKGQRYLIEACRLLAERGIPVACRFIGDGEDRRELEALIRASGMNGSLKLLGPRTQPEIRTLLAESDVLVVPSVPTRSGKREGIPVVLMEAMSSGLPVIASDLSGIPEIVRHGATGLLAQPGNPRSIADALGRLAADPRLRERLGRAGREHVLAEFDVRVNAARLADRFAAVGEQGR